MSYVKQNFVDGQTLTAAQLNHMEAGIANAAGTQGEKGDKGEKGDPGPAGAKGDPGEGFTANAKALLLNLFENAAYKTDTMQPTLNALRAEWGGSAQEVPGCPRTQPTGRWCGAFCLPALPLWQTAW